MYTCRLNKHSNKHSNLGNVDDGSGDLLGLLSSGKLDLSGQLQTL